MDFLNVASLLLEVSKPTGMWEALIFGIENLVKNYGLTIILITLIIKVVLLPFDVYNKYINKRNSVKMAVIQPEIEKIQKRYANNREMLNQKTMEVYKKHNYNVMGSCFGMIINMVIPMVIFFTLLSGLNGITAYKVQTEFETLKTTYEQQIGGQLVVTTVDENSVVKVKLEDGSVIDLTTENTEKANKAVIEKYKEIRENFLWIGNIWRPDTSVDIVLDYDSYIKNSKVSSESLSADVYYTVTSPISAEYSGWNGYYILIILSAVITYLSTQVSVWMGKLKAKKQGKPFVDAMSQNKVLLYVMPIVMALFTLFYSAMFAIYIVTGALFGLLTSPLVTIVVDKLFDKQCKKEEEKTRVSYSRK